MILLESDGMILVIAELLISLFLNTFINHVLNLLVEACLLGGWLWALSRRFHVHFYNFDQVHFRTGAKNVSCLRISGAECVFSSMATRG